ncbi:thiol peroxidase [Aerococcaceae bacterium zg-ZJ1578]|uniref:thiol peroxidase n=1 Tax=Aerococcaceae TaxID=186827 RepID=UPI0013B884C4|nr:MULTISPECIES: thiol peroxidase [unclassified Facklamia]MBK0348291.1 thiol peroxidase [Aerococcaceae bacterium zg-1578]NEW64577.1 thiol peroxidase [Facklamia sp. 252]NEW67902.1 thiol peroxidase [Facklamia sp. 253]QQD65390.1 thiol peroxidase [Aerococcaceae bacterium zg-252]
MTTFKGQPVTIVGKALQVGDSLPDFKLVTSEFEERTLQHFNGKKKVISIIPSVDTGICDTQTRRFNQDLSDMENAVVLTVSCDLPFAQRRWCGAAGIENAILLSDYYDHNFGKAYGALMEEWHLLARAVIVADEQNKVTYVEYLDNVNTHPDYEAAIAAARAIG